jgi:hypothetical protein
MDAVVCTCIFAVVFWAIDGPRFVFVKKKCSRFPQGDSVRLASEADFASATNTCPKPKTSTLLHSRKSSL